MMQVKRAARFAMLLETRYISSASKAGAAHRFPGSITKRVTPFSSIIWAVSLGAPPLSYEPFVERRRDTSGPTARRTLLTTYYSPPTTYYLPPTTCYPLPTTYYPLPTTYYPPPTTYYPLPTTHYRLATTFCLLHVSYYLGSDTY